MNEERASVQSNETAELRCEVCGATDAVEVGEQILCPSCYQAKGSCCPEFGADDLWTEHEEPASCREQK